MADVRSGLDPADYRFINPNPDPDFSPERNKAIVDQTIKEAEQYFTMLNMARDNDLEHRMDVLSSYGVYRFNKGTKGLKDYLGKQQYNAIIGENLLEKLRIAEATNKITRNSTIKKGILL
jgi:hypothetical protein